MRPRPARPAATEGTAPTGPYGPATGPRGPRGRIRAEIAPEVSTCEGEPSPASACLCVVCKRMRARACAGALVWARDALTRRPAWVRGCGGRGPCGPVRRPVRRPTGPGTGSSGRGGVGGGEENRQGCADCNGAPPPAIRAAPRADRWAARVHERARHLTVVERAPRAATRRAAPPYPP